MATTVPDGRATPILSGRLEHLQSLRALACTMVVFHHALNFSWPPGQVPVAWQLGAHGVEIFFVLSGFILAWSVAGRQVDAGRFLWRRLLRVAPLYWLASLLVARRDLLDPAVQADLLRDLSFVPRFSANYPGQLYPTMVPGWSLNYEVFFYLVLAVALLIGRRPLLTASLGLMALATVGWLVGPFDAAPAVFYTRPYVMLFVFGIALAWAVRHAFVLRHRPTLWMLAALALAAIAWRPAGPEWLSLGLPAAMLVWCAVCLSGEGARPWRPIVLIGEASYAIYLFHGWGQSATVALMRRGFGWSMPETTGMRLIELGLTVTGGLVVGGMAWLVLERPLMQLLSRRRSRTPRTMPLGKRPSPL